MTKASLESAAALLLGGAAEDIRNGGNSALSAALQAAGFIVLGAWVASEVWAAHARHARHDNDENT